MIYVCALGYLVGAVVGIVFSVRGWLLDRSDGVTRFRDRMSAWISFAGMFFFAVLFRRAGSTSWWLALAAFSICVWFAQGCWHRMEHFRRVKRALAQRGLSERKR